jgi:acyl phosphate:glycerol-3-phosphate acyltransferase
MNIALRLLCLLVGYCFGCIQWAYLIGRTKGIDIRNYGSGNSGTTNAMRVMGEKTGLIVFFLDLAKGLLCLLLIGALFGKGHPDMIYLLKMWAFAGVVLGHDYPFYMNFRGGKGVAVMAGFAFGYHISVLPFALVAFFVPFLTTHFVSLGSLLVYGVSCIVVVAEGHMGLYQLGSSAMVLENDLIMIALTVMAYWRHRENIKRLCNGNERKTYLGHHKEQ